MTMSLENHQYHKNFCNSGTIRIPIPETKSINPESISDHNQTASDWDLKAGNEISGYANYQLENR